jgi:hypothetical protein
MSPLRDVRRSGAIASLRMFSPGELAPEAPGMLLAPLDSAGQHGARLCFLRNDELIAARKG